MKEENRIMDNWTRLLSTQQTMLILKALVKTWDEVCSTLPTKFMCEGILVTSDNRGFYLTAYRTSGSLYFTMSFTNITQGVIEVCVTPYRYSKPIFDGMLVVTSKSEGYIESLVSQLHKNYIEVLSKLTPIVVSDRKWAEQFKFRLEPLVFDFNKDTSLHSKNSRVIKDLNQEFSYMFSRLTYLYERGIRSSRWVDSGSSVKDTDNSELIISENYLSFKTAFGREVGYIFKIKRIPEHKYMIFDFELSTDYGYLSKFTGHDLDYKLASHLASKIPEEQQLQFLNEVEECLVSLNLWSDYFIPMEYIYN